MKNWSAELTVDIVVKAGSSASANSIEMPLKCDQEVR